MNKLATVCFLLLLMVTPSVAQPIATKWESSIGLGFSAQRGNSESTAANYDLRTKRDATDEVFRAEVKGAWGDDGVETTVNNGKVETDYRWLLSDRLFWSFGGWAFYDREANVDYRINVGPALGYYFFRSDEFEFSSEIGPSYVWEEVEELKEDYFSPRFAERLKWQISKTSKLFHSAEIIINTEDTTDYIVTAEAGVEAMISDILGLRFTVRDIYDNEPADGNHKNDVNYVTALTVTF